MCAICAVFGGDEGDSAKFMTAFMSLRHRGPDAFRIESTSITSPHGLLGYHRLEVNETLNEKAMQPLKLGPSSLICNGDIYNWEQLSGYSKDAVSCDVEMILHLYETHGEDLKEFGSLLDGVFAFCLVDLKKKKIVVGRDKVGVRPLFKISSLGFLALASEKHGLLPFLEGHPERTVQLFPPGTIEEYAVRPDGMVVLKSIHQFGPCKRESGNGSFIAAVEKMIKLNFSKLGILIGYKQQVLCSGDMLELIYRSKFARKQAEMIQVFYDDSNFSPESLKQMQCLKNNYGRRFLFVDINQVIANMDATTVLSDEAVDESLWRLSKFIKQSTNVAILLLDFGCDEIIREKAEIDWSDIERFDRPTSMNGLEIRAPYLDYFYREEWSR